MDISIRSATKEDAAELLELWKAFMKDTESLDRPIPTHPENAARWQEFIKRLIEEDPRQIQVAEQNDVLVGYLVCQKVVTTPLDMGYNWSYVSDIYVTPTHRRKGLGKRLLQATIGYLKSEGSEHIRLAVWHRNKVAIQIYEQLGFKEHMNILQIDL
jgi:ribosomal protein S18 acetylase RimI-like enzyme